MHQVKDESRKSKVERPASEAMMRQRQRFSTIAKMVKQMKAAEEVTEALKARDPMQWVQRMNSIRDRAEEILREELIYV